MGNQFPHGHWGEEANKTSQVACNSLIPLNATITTIVRAVKRVDLGDGSHVGEATRNSHAYWA